jgi:ribosomal protein S18 acetylase RimI-like enzyme
MNYLKDNPLIKALYDHAVKCGISEECLLNKENLDNYVNTALDAYKDYSLFQYIFKGVFDPSVFHRMVSVDLRSRLDIAAGLSCINDYESVMILEPPMSRKTRMIEYFNVARPEDYSLLFKPILYRLESFEKFALDKRKQYLDGKTWYLYIFATRSEYKGRGYGKKLMDVLISFVDENGYRICLETNDINNIGMYEHFGFRTVEQSLYQNTLEHYNMLYEKA